MFKIIIPILVIALAAFVGMNAKSGAYPGAWPTVCWYRPPVPPWP